MDPGTHWCYPEVWPCSPCPPCLQSSLSCHTPRPRRSPGLLSAAPHPGSLPLLLTGQWLLALQDWPAAVSSPRSARLSPGQSLDSARIRPVRLHCCPGPSRAGHRAVPAAVCGLQGAYLCIFTMTSLPMPPKAGFLFFQLRYNLYKVH